MHHISFKGYYAGTPFCGSERNTEDEYSHLPYASPQDVQSFVARFIDCPQCKEIYAEEYLGE